MVDVEARLASVSSASAEGRVKLPPEIAEHVLSLGRVEWGQTHAHDAEGHGAHVADSVRLTAENFGQTEDQHMHGLWLAGTETVLCHTGTSPNAPKTTQALVGAWNWLVDQASASPEPVPATNQAGEEDIKGMVSRFLAWKLPSDFHPDAGITFKAAFNEHTEHPMTHEPTGTNLFTATQAEAMIRHLVGDSCPATDQTSAGWIAGNNIGQWRTFDSFGWAWTDRRDLAVRYARREDAELVHGEDEDSWRVEQYCPTALATQPATSQEGEACALCSGKGFADAQCPVCMIAATPTPPTLSEDLREALDWALAHIECRTQYDRQGQFQAALARSKAALNAALAQVKAS